MTTEPGWVRHVIWWRTYPLGFVGAFPQSDSDSTGASDHRLRRLEPWLDHVIELGASGIALGPIFTSTTHGYDTIDHVTIDPRLGDQHDFDAFVAAVRQRGLRLQLDGVFNHLGSHHPLALEALGSATSTAARWFRHTIDLAGRRQLSSFEGHGGLVELDHGEPAVADHVVQVMRHWLDLGVHAWRLDAAYRVLVEFWPRSFPRFE